MSPTFCFQRMSLEVLATFGKNTSHCHATVFTVSPTQSFNLAQNLASLFSTIKDDKFVQPFTVILGCKCHEELIALWCPGCIAGRPEGAESGGHSHSTENLSDCHYNSFNPSPSLEERRWAISLHSELCSILFSSPLFMNWLLVWMLAKQFYLIILKNSVVLYIFRALRECEL